MDQVGAMVIGDGCHHGLGMVMVIIVMVMVMGLAMVMYRTEK